MSSELNLDFEQLDSVFFPTGWTHKKVNGDFFVRNPVFRSDSIVRYHGKYSMCIDKTAFPDDVFTSKRIITLPDTVHRITLKGFIKTENVDGYAGLWLRIDGENGPIALENMMRYQIRGTNDWQEYSISLRYDPQQAKSIAFGGIIAGGGKLWIDDLHIYINDVDVSSPALAQIQTTHSLAATGLPLTTRQIRDFARLGSLWGFLKYHHPRLTSGNCNADNELFRMLNKVYSSQNRKETDRLFALWTDSLGIADLSGQLAISSDTTGSKCKPTYNILFNKRYFKKELIRNNKRILENRNCSTGQYYASGNGIVASFEKEAIYDAVSTDWPLRLLALFRYWNAIEYFYPYRNLIKDWDAVLFKYVDIFFNARNESEYILACQMLICEIEDAHAQIVNKHWSTEEGLTKFPPLKISLIQNKSVITEVYPASADDSISSLIYKGDVVTKINGLDIDSLVQKFLPLTSGSNTETKMRDVWITYLAKTTQPNQFLTVRNGSLTKNITIPTIPEKEYYERVRRLHKQEHSILIEDSVCYMPAFRFDLSYINNLLNTGDCKIKRVILDMRKPGDRQGILDSLLLFAGMYATATMPYCTFSGANFCIPGYFSILTSNLIYTSPLRNIQACPLKLFILVDENVQSAGECITMALQCIPGAITMGSRTAGADGNVTYIVLPGNVITSFTGIGVYYPGGRETQRIGIKVDHIVKRTIDNVRQGKDELIEAACHY